uniref:Uncharacterized protein n=1 Tax=Cannabis sativa TaxID=3483 RepID=A0A803Q9A4_CANSA
MGRLYGSMTEGISTEVMGCESSVDLWCALEALYGPSANLANKNNGLGGGSLGPGRGTRGGQNNRGRSVCYNRFDGTYIVSAPTSDPNKTSQSPTTFTVTPEMVDDAAWIIKRLHIDYGGEYQAFSNLVVENGIVFDHSYPDTSAQNGRAKRKHRHIVEIGLNLLAQASMP